MSELASEPIAAEPAAAEPAAPDAPDLAGADLGGEVVDAQPAEPVAEPVAAGPELDPLELQARLDHVQSQHDQLMGVLESLMGDPNAGAQQQPGQPQLDLSSLTDEFGQITPEGIAQLFSMQQQALLGQIDQRLQAFQQPLEAQRAAEVEQRGEDRLKDILAADIAVHGEFASTPQADADARARVRERADAIFEELAPMYGASARTAELAMQRAAQAERQYIAGIRGEGQAQALNRLSTLAGAPGEPGTAANGGIAGRPDFGTNTGSIVDHYAREARRLSQAAGGA